MIYFFHVQTFISELERFHKNSIIFSFHLLPYIFFVLICCCFWLIIITICCSVIYFLTIFSKWTLWLSFCYKSEVQKQQALKHKKIQTNRSKSTSHNWQTMTFWTHYRKLLFLKRSAWACAFFAANQSTAAAVFQPCPTSVWFHLGLNTWSELIFSISPAKSWKLHKLLKLISSFYLLNLGLPTRGGSARKGYLFFRLHVYEKVGISPIEVYERVAKSVISAWNMI